MEKRRVFLKGGMAYVPAKEQSSIVFQAFQTHLEKALEVNVLISYPKAQELNNLPLFSLLPKHFRDWTKILE